MTTHYLQQTFGLQGRTALVTGSARGLGFSIAQALGAAGATVVINDLHLEDCLQAASTLAAMGINTHTSAFDVTSETGVQTAFNTLKKNNVNVDILVSNAGNQNRKPITEMTLAEWQKLQDVHVNGAFNCVKAVLPDMIERQAGNIVLMSSIAGQASMPNIAAYATAKGAISAFTRAIAAEQGMNGITCNAIAPGFIQTQFTQGLSENPEFQKFITESVPLGRWGTPEEIAPAFVYLCSPAGRFINGHTLTIDGGLLSRM